MILNSKFWVKTSLLLAVSLTAMTGAIMAPALPDMSEYFQKDGGTDFYTKLILTMPALVNALLAPGVGWITDRFGRRNLLLISIILYCIAGLSGYFIDNLWTLLASRAIFGLGVAGIMGASTTMIGDYFTGFERNRFMGIQSAILALSGVLFVNLSGLLAEWSWRGVFLMYSFAFLVLPICFQHLKPAKQQQSSSFTDQPAIQLSDKSRIFVTARIILMSIIGMICYYVTPVQIPFLLKELGFSNNLLIGFSISISTLFGTISSFSFGKLKSKFHYRYLYFLCFLLGGLGYIIISYSSNLYLIFAGLAVSGLGFGLLMPTGNLWVMDITPFKYRGRLISGISASFFLGQFISPIAIASFIDGEGLMKVFFLAGISTIFIGSINLIKLARPNNGS